MRDLVDTAFSLLVDFASKSQQEQERITYVFGYFRDKGIEYETGELVLPSWAAIGNVAAHYGNDGSDPFAEAPDDPSA